MAGWDIDGLAAQLRIAKFHGLPSRTPMPFVPSFVWSSTEANFKKQGSLTLLAVVAKNINLGAQ